MAEEHKTPRLHMATTASTEKQAVATLTERAALYYGVEHEWIMLFITSTEQHEVLHDLTLNGPARELPQAEFNVEAYAVVRREYR